MDLEAGQKKDVHQLDMPSDEKEASSWRESHKQKHVKDEEEFHDETTNKDEPEGPVAAATVIVPPQGESVAVAGGRRSWNKLILALAVAFAIAAVVVIPTSVVKLGDDGGDSSSSDSSSSSSDSSSRDSSSDDGEEPTIPPPDDGNGVDSVDGLLLILNGSPTCEAALPLQAWDEPVRLVPMKPHHRKEGVWIRVFGTGDELHVFSPSSCEMNLQVYKGHNEYCRDVSTDTMLGQAYQACDSTSTSRTDPSHKGRSGIFFPTEKDGIYHLLLSFDDQQQVAGLTGEADILIQMEMVQTVQGSTLCETAQPVPILAQQEGGGTTTPPFRVLPPQHAKHHLLHQDGFWLRVGASKESNHVHLYSQLECDLEFQVYQGHNEYCRDVSANTAVGQSYKSPSCDSANGVETSTTRQAPMTQDDGIVMVAGRSGVRWNTQVGSVYHIWVSRSSGDGGGSSKGAMMGAMPLLQLQATPAVDASSRCEMAKKLDVYDTPVHVDMRPLQRDHPDLADDQVWFRVIGTGEELYLSSPSSCQVQYQVYDGYNDYCTNIDPKALVGTAHSSCATDDNTKGSSGVRWFSKKDDFYHVLVSVPSSTTATKEDTTAAAATTDPVTLELTVVPAMQGSAHCHAAPTLDVFHAPVRVTAPPAQTTAADGSFWMRVIGTGDKLDLFTTTTCDGYDLAVYAGHNQYCQDVPRDTPVGESYSVCEGVDDGRTRRSGVRFETEVGGIYHIHIVPNNNHNSQEGQTTNSLLLELEAAA